MINVLNAAKHGAVVAVLTIKESRDGGNERYGDGYCDEGGKVVER